MAVCGKRLFFVRCYPLRQSGCPKWATTHCEYMLNGDSWLAAVDSEWLFIVSGYLCLVAANGDRLFASGCPQRRADHSEWLTMAYGRWL